MRPYDDVIYLFLQKQQLSLVLVLVGLFWLRIRSLSTIIIGIGTGTCIHSCGGGYMRSAYVRVCVALSLLQL